MSVSHQDSPDIAAGLADKCSHPGRDRSGAAVLIPVVLLTTAILWFWVMAVQTRGLVVDDAYIGFQHLKNWMAGEGFTFNAGMPPVEGVTNIAWLAGLWPLASLLGVESAARVLGLGLAGFGLILTAWLAARVDDDRGLVHGAAAGLLLVLSFDFTYFTLAGMETGLLAALLLAMAFLVLRSPLHWGLVPLGAVAGFTHPESLVIVPLYLACRAARAGQNRGRAVGLMAAYALAIGFLIALRYWWFGDVVPNTFHSKPSGFGGIVAQLAGYATGGAENISAPFGNLALGLVMIAGLARIARTAGAFAGFAGVTVITGIAFALYSQPDWTERGRYFAPYLPLAWIAMVYGASEILARLVGDAKRMAQASLALLMVTAAGLFLDTGLQFGSFKSYPGYVLAGEPLKPAAEWLKEELEPDAVIATRRIGIIGFLTGREVFDYAFGLADKEVSRLISARGMAFDDPGEALLGPLWRERSPGYLLEDRSQIDIIIRKAGGRDQAFVLHGLDYCVVKSFPLAENQDWVLAGRRNGPLPCLP